MELSVYHLAIITVIAFLFFFSFISFTMSYNNEQATKQYQGVASRVGTGSKKGARAKALYAEVLI